MRTVRSNVNDLLSRSSFRRLVAEGRELAVELVEMLSTSKSNSVAREYWD